MAELMEYVLVFAISAGVAGASVAVVQGAVPGLDKIASVSRSDQIAGAARIAVLEGGSATLMLPLQGTTISCQSGLLTVSDAGGSTAYEIGYPCSFGFPLLEGTCTLLFSAPEGSLLLGVAC